MLRLNAEVVINLTTFVSYMPATSEMVSGRNANK